MRSPALPYSRGRYAKDMYFTLGQVARDIYLILGTRRGVLLCRGCVGGVVEDIGSWRFPARHGRCAVGRGCGHNRGDHRLAWLTVHLLLGRKVTAYCWACTETEGKQISVYAVYLGRPHYDGQGNGVLKRIDSH